MPRLTPAGLGVAVAATAATLALASCGPAPIETGGIPQGEYVLVGMDGGTVPLRNVTLSLAGTQITGRGPCNSFSTQNSATLPALQLSPIASTRMYCKDAPLEGRFFSVLQSATSMEYSGGVLKVKSPETWLILERGHRADEVQVSAVEAARGTQ
ncbi:META domain-containing protein [Paracoccus seriniphilus]|uniref:Heat shock protein HslJ n=1 Tax=Paracoccus seriniphilus TaxID=184748 RepID=A0A239PRR3_9RHOB|nr:META domain-containing protein [Paracoccus seriniphilus]WCR14327.1 META domain-containing protein [Paracoccus seriniphilus]SNT72965.1 Heat shock protein HslJ [Paracoccus seriniphilus]